MKNEHDINSLLREGDAARRRGDTAAAVVAYMRAGDLYASTHNHLKALTVWKAILTLAPGRLDVRLMLGESLSWLGLRDEAIVEFRTVLDEAARPSQCELRDRAKKALEALAAS